MYEKQGFFKLEISDQKRLRSFMVLYSVVQIIITLFASRSVSLISPIIGIVANLLLLYFSIFITRAPNLYFQLFVWMVLITIIFDGMEIYQAFSNQQLWTFRIILDLLSIGLVAIFTPLIIKHRRYSNDAKRETGKLVI